MVVAADAHPPTSRPGRPMRRRRAAFARSPRDRRRPAPGLRLATGFDHRRRQRRPVRVVDLPGRSGSPGDELVAGREDRDERTPRTATSPMPREARTPATGGQRPAQQDHVSGACRARPLTNAPGATGDGTETTPSDSATSSIGTTASAPGGIGAPVMIRTAVPARPAGGSRAGSDLAGDTEDAGRIGGAQREAVHRGVGERRDVDAATIRGSARTRPASARATRSSSVGRAAPAGEPGLERQHRSGQPVRFMR